ncbi:unnamed protein product, partial [Polarella glacialis]
VKRAVGEIVRAQRSTGPGMESALGALEKLLSNADVYELARLVASVAGLGSLFIATVLGLQDVETPGFGEGGPMKMLKGTMVAVLRTVWAPRLWLVLALVASFVVGNWSVLGKLLRKPGVLEILRSVSGLFRALGLAGAVCGATALSEGPMPSWAMLSSAAAVARASRLMVYERLSLNSLMAILTTSKARGVVAGSTLGALGMEVWCVLVLLPFMLRKRRQPMQLLALAWPCIALLVGGASAAPLEPYLELALQKSGLAVAILSILTIFMGGFPTMISSLALVQALMAIHKLDQAKF